MLNEVSFKGESLKNMISNSTNAERNADEHLHQWIKESSRTGARKRGTPKSRVEREKKYAFTQGD